MARVTNNGITGLVGNLVFYTMNGKSYVRARPSKRKGKSKKRAEDHPISIFGTVSKYGTMMLREVSKSFLFPFSRSIYNGLRGWIRNEYAANYQAPIWEMAYTNRICPFNKETDLRDYWRKDITVTDNGNGKITIHIPEFNPLKDVKVPTRTMKVNMKLVAVRNAFKGSLNTCSTCTKEISFEYSSTPVPAQAFELQTPTAGTGDIAFLIMALEYSVVENGVEVIVKDEKWTPAAIVAMGRLK